MPRLTKSQELTKWMQPCQVFNFKVKYESYSIHLAVIAETKLMAEMQVRNEYKDAQDIQIVFVSNRILVV